MVCYYDVVVNLFNSEFCVMKQSWRELLFAHWSYAPELLTPLLPARLELDLFNGKAWLGIVPFLMRYVRPNGLPALPWLSNFLEVNVRTYVIGPDGTKGVWFFSLDSNQPFAVEIARTCFKLPYFHAQLTYHKNEEVITYTSLRRDRRSPLNATKESLWKYPVPKNLAPAQADTLDYFLVERYHLFSNSAGHLYQGRVQHEPYLIAPTKLESFDTELLRWNELPFNKSEPEHVCYSSGVDVEIFPLKKVR